MRVSVALATDDASAIAITDWQVVGDGKTPTFLQYLDTQKGTEPKEAGHLASTSLRGEATYSIPLVFPPAILAPSLSLSYSSEAGVDAETSYGWKLSGIPEIHRPLARAYETRDKDEWYGAEWTLSGPGFSGTLVPSGKKDWKFLLRTSSPALVTAAYDKDKNTWTVFSDTLTITLEAEDYAKATTKDTTAGTELWRATEINDALGNSITFCYNENGLFQTMTYGGNATTGEADLITVAAAYGDNAVTRTFARAGFVTKYEQHIEKITIQSGSYSACSDGTATANTTRSDQTRTTWANFGFGSGGTVDADDAEDSANRLYAYDLIYTVTDSLDLLTKVEREGKTSLTVEVIFNGEYSKYDSSASVARTSTDAPASLGESRSVKGSGTSTTPISETTKSLADFNRDGLPDVVDASASDVATSKLWQVASQAVDYTKRSFGWNDTKTVAAVGGVIDLSTTHELEVGDETALPAYNPAYTTRQFIDFDGDGYIDIVESGSATAWTVYYGNSGHGYGGGTTETPPAETTLADTDASDTDTTWTYLAKTHRFRADHMRGDIWDANEYATDAIDALYGMVDFNGDGWQDLYRPDTGVVWLHSGKRGGGWGTQLVLTQKFDSIRSVNYGLYGTEMTFDISSLCDYIGAMMGVDLGTGYTEPANYSYIKCADSITGTSYGIGYTDETQAFYDMNGDGLPDRVDARTTPWKVYLNTGYDFEISDIVDGDANDWAAPVKYIQRVDEGMPNIFPCHAPTRCPPAETGKPIRVYQTLMDVDGDGLLDLAIGNSLDLDGDGRDEDEDTAPPNEMVWFPNTGAGFGSSRPLPAGWGDEFTKTWAGSELEYDTETASPHSYYTSTTYKTITDIDRDGVLDYVSITYDDDADGEDESGTNSVSYGAYPRPYLLTKIKNGQGGTTELNYRSSATTSPAGDWDKTQSMAVAKNLVDTVASVDGLTGQSAETDYDYADGDYQDGVFKGFGSRDIKRYINGSWTSKTSDVYELDRDFAPLVTTRKFYTDFNLNFAPSLDKGAINEGLRYKTVNTYGDTGTLNTLHLLKGRKVTEYGEKSGSKSTTMAYVYDNYGNLTLYTHDGGGVTDDAKTVAMSYVADADGKFYRMRQKGVTGVAPLTGVKGIASTETYYYDNHASDTDALDKGLLTKTETWAGWVGGGASLDAEKLAIDYDRGSRGELTSVSDSTTGIKMDQTFGFGAAVLETQTNGLGQKLTRTIDSQGRITSIKDDNGLTLTMTYDAFNRVTKKEVTGTDGATYTLEDFDYAHKSAPYYTKHQLYDETKVVTATDYTVEDGFGHSVQTWAQNLDGHLLKTTEINDLRDLTATTSHPKDMGTSFTAPMTSISVPSTFGKTYYDALGEAREVIRDNAVPTGSSLAYHDSPQQTITQDEAGHQTKLTYDAHGRVIKVEQGKASSYKTMAQYRYDPLDRLVRFKDGGGVIYTYSLDGAGRLREAKYGGTISTTSGTGTLAITMFKPFSTSWYKYDYKGLLKTKMTDAAGGTTAWEYDEIGRPKTMTVSGSLPTASADVTEDALVYTYAYDDAWVGAVAKTTDPAGTTEYTYDKFGREATVKRTYNASSILPKGKTAEFQYDHDLSGHLTSKTLPSSRVLSLTYAYNHLKKISAASALGVTDYSLTFKYNDWNLWKTVTSSLGHEFSRTFTTPLWPDELKTQYGTKAYTRGYKWLNNGLLTKRTDSTKTGSLTTLGTRYDYSYDALKQLTLMTSTSATSAILGSTSTKTIESYAYDAAGNPTAMQDSAGVQWTYAAAGKLNQIASRTPSTGTSETYTYDKAGRVATWKNASGTYTYYYDAMGRLRAVYNGTWQEVLDYDTEGNLVRRGDNVPASSPYYTDIFRDWRFDEKVATSTEDENAFVSTEGGVRSWLFGEADGHVAMTFDDSGTKTSARTLGAFGKTLSSSGTPLARKSFHGTEEKDELFLMGQRHLMKKDGQWLQPEPLLYLGIPDDNLVNPLSLATYRYAMNSPTTYADTSGFDPDDDKTDTTTDTTTKTKLDTSKMGNAFVRTTTTTTTTQSSVNPAGTPDQCGREAMAHTDRALGTNPNATIDDYSDVTELPGGGQSLNNIAAHYEEAGANKVFPVGDDPRFPHETRGNMAFAENIAASEGPGTVYLLNIHSVTIDENGKAVVNSGLGHTVAYQVDQNYNAHPLMSEGWRPPSDSVIYMYVVPR